MTIPPITHETFRSWLDRYGSAWENRDPEAAAALFTADACYHWTPLSEPKRGPEGVAAAWEEATTRQRNVRFTYQILAVVGDMGIARWHTRLERAGTGRTIEIDGILTAEFDEMELCRVFREWWHSTEG